MCSCSTSSTVDFFRHVNSLADSAGDEWLDGSHHFNVAKVMDRVIAHSTGKDFSVLRLEVRGTRDRTVLSDVVNDVVTLALV